MPNSKENPRAQSLQWASSIHPIPSYPHPSGGDSGGTKETRRTGFENAGP